MGPAFVWIPSRRRGLLRRHLIHSLLGWGADAMTDAKHTPLEANLLEILRGIAAMPETDGARMKLWATDSLSGHSETVEATILNVLDERNALKDINEELLDFIENIQHFHCIRFREHACGQHGLLDKYRPEWRQGKRGTS